MSPALPRLLTVLGLGLITVLLAWPPVTAWGLAGAMPAAGLGLVGIRPGRRWGGWVAVLMIPYFGAAAMNLIAGPMQPVPALLFSVASIASALSGLDWMRRTGASMRG